MPRQAWLKIYSTTRGGVCEYRVASAILRQKNNKKANPDSNLYVKNCLVVLFYKKDKTMPMVFIYSAGFYSNYENEKQLGPLCLCK